MHFNFSRGGQPGHVKANGAAHLLPRLARLCSTLSFNFWPTAFPFGQFLLPKWRPRWPSQLADAYVCVQGGAGGGQQRDTASACVCASAGVMDMLEDCENDI